MEEQVMEPFNEQKDPVKMYEEALHKIPNVDPILLLGQLLIIADFSKEQEIKLVKYVAKKESE